MAINTAARRAACIGLAVGVLFPPPDGTISQPDRQAIARTYPGVTADSPPQWNDDRASMISVGAGVRVFPEPQSSLDAADRQHIAWLYRGILAEAGSEPEEQTGGLPRSYVLPNGMRIRATYAEAVALWERLNLPGEPAQVAETKQQTKTFDEIKSAALTKLETAETVERNDAARERAERERAYRMQALALLLTEA